MNLLIKIFGWGLLIVGIIIIGWTLYSSYNIFTGKTAAPEVFKVEIEKIPTSPPQKKLPLKSTEIQKDLEKMVAEQLRGILPVETIPKILNLAAWSMLAFILIFGGSQISTLGIKLIISIRKS